MTTELHFWHPATSTTCYPRLVNVEVEGTKWWQQCFMSQIRNEYWRLQFRTPTSYNAKFKPL